MILFEFHGDIFRLEPNENTSKRKKIYETKIKIFFSNKFFFLFCFRTPSNPATLLRTSRCPWTTAVTSTLYPGCARTGTTWWTRWWPWPPTWVTRPRRTPSEPSRRWRPKRHSGNTRGTSGQRSLSASSKDKWE